MFDLKVSYQVFRWRGASAMLTAAACKSLVVTAVSVSHSPEGRAQNGRDTRAAMLPRG